VKSIIGQYEKIIRNASKGLHSISGGAIFAMALLTCADVIMRFLGGPIRGALDIVRFLSVITVSFAIAYAQVQKAHTSMEFVVLRLTGRSKAIVESIVYLLSLGLFVLLARQSCLFARRLWLAGEVSPTIEVPLFPLVFLIAIGASVLCLVLMADLIRSLKKALAK
jgi:TRAP-type C4-dicarboxylate transport system permease small subunit